MFIRSLDIFPYVMRRSYKSKKKLPKIANSGFWQKQFIKAGQKAEKHPSQGHIHSKLSTNKGIIFKGERFVIPKILQPDILKQPHAAPLGIEKPSKEPECWLTGHA